MFFKPMNRKSQIFLILFLPMLHMARAQITNLHAFNGTDGWGPNAIVVSGDTIFGTTGGDYLAPYYGTLFKMKTDGTGFTNLYTFTNGVSTSCLILAGNVLYGCAGTIFAINIDGTGFRTIDVYAYGLIL